MPRKKIPRKRGLCEICGALIPDKPGMPAKTCGAECAAERHRRRERARYHRVKDTPQYKATRADYLVVLKTRLDADPEFAVIYYARQRENLRKHRAKRNGDPNIRQQDLENKRMKWRRWREHLVQDEQAWDAYKAKCRAWYHNLSDEDYERIFAEPQRRRGLAKRRAKLLEVMPTS